MTSYKPIYVIKKYSMQIIVLNIKHYLFNNSNLYNHKLNKKL